jgi:hypothetical protein
MRKHWAWSLLIAGLLVVLFYPETLIVVPAYHVKLVDRSGKPFANTGVSELWQQTSLQRMEMLNQVMTNAQGEVLLPERTVRASLLRRMIGCLDYLGRQGFGAPCGNSYSITAAGDLKELARTETVTGLLRYQHSLVLILEVCDKREPVLC